MDKTLSVIIPAYNEEDNIQLAIESATDVLRQRGIDYELLVFNDGSRDQTGFIVDQLAQKDPKIKATHHQYNMGYGYITCQGFKTASKNYVTWLSGDHSVEKDSFAHIVDCIGKKDVIVAYMENIEVRSSSRRIISDLFTHLLNFIFRLKFKYYTGPSVYPTHIVNQMDFKSRGYSIVAEILIRCLKSGYSFVEVPFTHRADNDQQSKALSIRNIMSVFPMVMILVRDIYSRSEQKGKKMS